MDSFHVNKSSVLGYEVCSEDLQSIVGTAMKWIEEGHSCRWLACINPHSYVVARAQPEAAEALRQADWLVPDGVGIVLASRALGGAIRNRITGSDIFRAVNARLANDGGGVFLLGSTEATLRAIEDQLTRDWPSLRVVGAFAPPFKDTFSAADTEAMVSAVNAASADVLWVGMTSPKQDMWIAAHRHKLDVRFAAAIGAVFDFYSGRVKRSDPIFQKFGLEWLPRLLQEPRRLWRRMFVSAPIFIWDLIRALLIQRN